MTNPLLTPGDVAAFGHLDAALVAPAIDSAIAAIEQERGALLAREADDGAFVESLDRLTERLEWAYGITAHLESVLPDATLRDALAAAQPRASTVWAALATDGALYERLARFRASAYGTDLKGPAARLVDKTLESLRRSGAALPASARERLRAIDVRLGELGLTFSQNVVDDSDGWHLTIDGGHELSGLPSTYVDLARSAAERAGEAGYRLTLSPPLVTATLTYAESRTLREAVYRAWNARATKAPRENAPLIRELLALRAEKARLLGFSDFSDLVTVERMAKGGSTAHAFVRELRTHFESGARREHDELAAFARGKAGIVGELEAWDVAFVAEKLRADRYAFDEELLRDYLPYDHVRTTVFELLDELFGLRFEAWDGAPRWHPDVEAFRILDADRNERGALWLDPFPREGKRDGAWMDGLRLVPGGTTNCGQNLAVVCGNFSPREAGGTARLQHRDVETLLHELGHFLHHVASTSPFVSLGGTRVAEDFVEVPSQLLENWGWEPQVLRRLGRHWKTGEAIPESLVAALLRTRTYRAATASMRQLGFGEVDLTLHREFDPLGEESPVARARAILEAHSPTRLPADHAMLASFHHLFASPVGYAAGYYVYKWAEVIEADFFERIREEGLFDPAVGRRLLAQVYAVGNSVEASAIVREFLGRDSDPLALLRRSGLA